MKKIILLFIIGIFLINLVSAGDWFDYDNYKFFDKNIGKYGKIFIMDKSLFGKDNILQTIELKTNTEICPGDFCSATKEVIMYNGGKLIDEVRFFDLKTNRLTNIKSYEIYVDKKLYDGKEVNGNSKGIAYQVELRGKINPFQIVDWQIKSQGFWIDEWAVWSSGLNKSLKAYYDFDETSGTSLPNKVSASFSGTLYNMGDGNWMLGKINNALYFNGSNEYTNHSANGLLTYQNWSISIWLKPDKTDAVGEEFFFESEGRKYQLYRLGSTSKIRVFGDSVMIFEQDAVGKWVAGSWIHIGVVFENSNCSIYFNGALSATNTTCITSAQSINTFLFGSTTLYSSFYSGLIDEVAIWNRSVTSDEMVELYNGGEGVTYISEPFDVNLNSPTNATVFSETSKNLIASYFSWGYVLKNATYNIWFDNSTIFNQSTFNIDTSVNVTNISFSGFIPENYLWNIEACGENLTSTYCKFANNNYTFTVGISNLGETYNILTTEGNREIFKINISTLTDYGLSEAKLIYDGNASVGTFTSSNYDYYITNQIIIPSVNVDINLTFYWSLTLETGFVINTTSHEQRVIALTIDDCTAESTLILNFTLRDEENQTILDGTKFNITIELNVNIYPIGSTTAIMNFSNKIEKINPTLICISDDLSSSSNGEYRLDATIKYESLDRELEYYHIQNFSLTNSTIPQHIGLYDLLISDSTEFQLTFTGSNFLTIENALVFVKRQYVSEGIFRTVELPKTDSNGQTILHLVRNDILYNIEIMKEGVVIGNFENIIVFCEDIVIGNCKIILSAAESGRAIFDYNNDLGIAYTGPTYDNITRIITFNFLTTDGSVKNVLMNATRNDIFGNISICSASIVSSGATLICRVPSYIEDSTIITKIFVDGKETLKDYIILSKFNYGKSGYFIFFVYMLAFILMFSKSKTTMLIGIIVGFIVGISLGLISGKLMGIGASGIWLVIVVILMIWKLNKERPN